MKHFTRVLWFLSALAFFAAGCQSEDAVGALEVTSYDIPADMVLLQPVDGKVVTVHYRNGDGRTARVVVEPGSGIYAAGSQIVKLAPGAQDGQFEITLKGTSFVNDVSLPVTLTVEGQDPVNFNIELNISGEVILDAPNSSATGHYYIGAALTSDNALRLAYLAGRSRDVNIQVASPVGLTGQADATLEYMDGVVEIPLAGTLTNPSSIAQPEGNDPAVTGIYYVPCTVTVTWTGTDATRTTTVLVPVTADPYADNIGIVMRRVDVLGLP